MGPPLTGRSFAYRQPHLPRFVDGLAIEQTAVGDDAALVRQVIAS
jgi:predicted ester cyclase